MKVLLLNLQEWLISESETEANTIALHEYLTNNEINAEDSEKKEIWDIVDNLTNATVVSAVWWTEYDIAKAEILWILPKNLRTAVSRLFNDFEVAEVNFQESWSSQQDERKAKLQEIVNTIKGKTTQDLENQKEDEITKSDLDEVVIPNICKIMNYYNIPSNTNLCGLSEGTIAVPDDKNIQKVSKNKLSTGLKVLLISLSSLIWIFLILVILFAIKAKINRSKEEEEE